MHTGRGERGAANWNEDIFKRKVLLGKASCREKSYPRRRAGNSIALDFYKWDWMEQFGKFLAGSSFCCVVGRTRWINQSLPWPVHVVFISSCWEVGKGTGLGSVVALGMCHCLQGCCCPGLWFCYSEMCSIKKDCIFFFFVPCCDS